MSDNGQLDLGSAHDLAKPVRLSPAVSRQDVAPVAVQLVARSAHAGTHGPAERALHAHITWTARWRPVDPAAAVPVPTAATSAALSAAQAHERLAIIAADQAAYGGVPASSPGVVQPRPLTAADCSEQQQLRPQGCTLRSKGVNQSRWVSVADPQSALGEPARVALQELRPMHDAVAACDPGTDTFLTITSSGRSATLGAASGRG